MGRSIRCPVAGQEGRWHVSIILEPGEGLATGRAGKGGPVDPALFEQLTPLIGASVGAQAVPGLVYAGEGSAASAGFAYKRALQDLAAARETPVRIVSLARRVSVVLALPRFTAPTVNEDGSKTSAAQRKAWTEEHVPETLRNADPDTSWTFVLERQNVTEG